MHVQPVPVAVQHTLESCRAACIWRLLRLRTSAMCTEAGSPRAEIFLLMAATSQSNSLAYRFLARASLLSEAAVASRDLMKRSPTVSIARVVSAVSS